MLFFFKCKIKADARQKMSAFSSSTSRELRQQEIQEKEYEALKKKVLNQAPISTYKKGATEDERLNSTECTWTVAGVSHLKWTKSMKVDWKKNSQCPGHNKPLYSNVLSKNYGQERKEASKPNGIKEGVLKRPKQSRLLLQEISFKSM